MPEAAVALGSNLGDRAALLRSAIEHLRTLGTVTAISTFLDTPPALYFNQPRFLNAAVLLHTALAPEALMRALLSIEQAMGRVRTGVPPKGPRSIDLDLIFYDSVTLETPRLTLPHPALHLRDFVLAPLAEIAPHWLHPTLHRTPVQLLEALTQS